MIVRKLLHELRFFNQISLSTMTVWYSHFLPYWKTFFALTVLITSLVCCLISQTQELRCGITIITISLLWMTEALPLAVTSLLPVVFLPLYGVMSTSAVCTSYLKDTTMMYIGALVSALAVERSNLHRRLALGILVALNLNFRWLLLGFMLTTMFLSMWMSNTAATTIMIPVLDAVIEELYKEREDSVIRKESPEEESTGSDFILTGPARISKEGLRLRKAILLSIAYSSSLGGTGTITGSSPNFILKGILEEKYPTQNSLSYGSWMLFCVPLMLLSVLLTWLWIQGLFIGFKRKREEDRHSSQVRAFMKSQYSLLGSVRYEEAATMCIWIATTLLFFFREPQFMPGWGQVFTKMGVSVGDSTVSVGMAILFFLLPKEPFWRSKRIGNSGTLMEWKYVERRMPWELIFLIGAGIALSDASKKSGLSALIGSSLSALEYLPPFAILFIITFSTCCITEVMSNTATATILLPVLADLCEAIRMNPLYLMLPASLACSYAFMLPVATPSNAIVYSAGNVKTLDMVKTGLVMNLVCIFALCVTTETLGVLVFDLHHFPSWANSTVL